ncbi:glycosyltransferase [Uliginosibacterium sp. 31-12]|uniref:glycosyltransferase n=1 Tax=Uliginosibacterium sp. 31-12 TaxID=3062781 RepID=UPI0026E2F86D|nr:glycosyltransferase [Uliginosibacterium sp. 31-12]MDO6387118.1 glycosyltransferase [Uliginosibacterium sp. 31-12]
MHQTLAGDGPSRRIGLLIDSLIGGGAERVVLNLAEGFRRQGHEVHIILAHDQIQHRVPDGVRLHALAPAGRLNPIRALEKLMLAWRLRRCVAEIEADGRRFDFFISNAEDADRISRLACLPHVYIRYRNSMVEYLRGKIGDKAGLKRLFRTLKWRIRFHLTYGGRDIITVSDALQRDIVDEVGVHPHSIRTIYNPFDFEAIRQLAREYQPPVDGPYIVYAARFSARKRQDLLLRAFCDSHACQSHKLVLIGDAYTEAEKNWREQIALQVASLGLQDKVLLPGFQTNPYPWIKHAALFAMSSDSEGLPTVLIESLILGTPVVSTDCPTGPSEILTGRLSPFLCARNDHLALAVRIDEALAHYPHVGDRELARFSAENSIRQYLAHCAEA